MKLYAFNEIQNKHGQPIYYFSKQSGNTELEKCINFMNQMGTNFIQFDSPTINSGDISCIVIPDSDCQVFNNIGEKVGQFEIDYTPNMIHDMYDDLNDIGFQIN